MRYSYVLHFPNNHASFGDMHHRWQSFLGEFAKPIAEKFPDLLFWSSYYYSAAKFRVESDSEEVHKFIEQKIKDTGLLFNPDEEKNDTLVGDLGAARFIDQNLGAEAVQRRADLVLKFLCATARLYSDGLVKVNATHWEYRLTPSDQNPLGNNFESLAHLVANVSRFEFDVFAQMGTAWQQGQNSQGVRCRLWS